MLTNLSTQLPNELLMPFHSLLIFPPMLIVLVLRHLSQPFLLFQFQFLSTISNTQFLSFSIKIPNTFFVHLPSAFLIPTFPFFFELSFLKLLFLSSLLVLFSLSYSSLLNLLETYFSPLFHIELQMKKLKLRLLRFDYTIILLFRGLKLTLSSF